MAKRHTKTFEKHLAERSAVTSLHELGSTASRYRCRGVRGIILTESADEALSQMVSEVPNVSITYYKSLHRAAGPDANELGR